MASPPDCPICGTTDARVPDALGVHRCPGCAVEFRPPGRMPVRRAVVTVVVPDQREGRGWIVALVVIGAIVGFAAAVGDRKADKLPSYDFSPPVTIDPEMLALPEINDPFATPLGYELHQSQLEGNALFATGLVFSQDVLSVEDVRVVARLHDNTGATLESVEAIVACRTLASRDSCAWMIDAKLAQPVADLEFVPTGRIQLSTSGPRQLELRNTRGELEFDPELDTVTFEIPAGVLFQPSATVTTVDSRGRVLAIAETRWSRRLEPGRQTLNVNVPKRDDEVASYEVRLSGDLVGGT